MPGCTTTSWDFPSLPDLCKNSNNRLTYQHNGSETTGDSFSFTVADPLDNTISETAFGINVTPVNDAPVANPDKTLTVAEDANPTSLSITAPTDAEGNSLTITVSTIPDSAKGSVRLADGTAVAGNQVLTTAELQQLVFVPVTNANGNAGVFRYTVSDGQTGTAFQTVTLDITSRQLTILQLPLMKLL